MNSFFSIENFKKAAIWIFIILAIIAFFLGYFVFESNDTLRSLLYKIGEILAISVCFSFLTSCAELLGIFKKGLEEIMYFDERYLRNRKDIHTLWINVSKALFKSKFPSISTQLMHEIKRTYLHEEEISYYSFHKRNIDIQWDPEDSSFIIVKEKSSFNVHTINKDKLTIPQTHSVTVNDLAENQYYVKLIKSVINNKPVQPNISEKKTDDIYTIKYDFELEGSEEYNFELEIEKRYSIKYDFFIGFKAKYFVNNLTVELFYPDNMNIEFIDRGTTNNYKCTNKNKERKCLEYSYKGLILQKQGYILILNRQ